MYSALTLAEKALDYVGTRSLMLCAHAQAEAPVCASESATIEVEPGKRCQSRVRNLLYQHCAYSHGQLVLIVARTLLTLPLSGASTAARGGFGKPYFSDEDVA